MRLISPRLAGCVLAVLAVACTESPRDPTAPAFAKAPSGPTVTATNPGASVRDTTLVVQVLGSGFDNGSQAQFLLNGAPDPKVVTNSTSFVSSTEVDANITIAIDAVPTYRDVAVTTSGGKKGIGTAKFQVLEPIVIPVLGATNPEAWDVNAAGMAVGNYGVANTTCTGRGFAWTQANGTIILPVPTGYCDAGARVVNESGLIAGSANDGSGLTATLVARWLPTGPGTWSVEVLPKPAANLVWQTVHGVNGAGSVVTTWKNTDGTVDSWVWRSTSGWQQLAAPAGRSFCIAQALNDNEEIVGYCKATVGGAYYWASPVSPPVLLPTPSTGWSSKGNAITSLGVIAGSWVQTQGRTTQERLARWQPDGAGGWIMTDLAIAGTARDLNEDGTILGQLNGDVFVLAPGLPVSHLDPLDKTKGITWAALSSRGPGGVAWIAGWAQAGASSGGGYLALVWKR